MTREQIKQFILDYCNGQIYTEMDVPQNVLGMVFMPLTFGALSPPWEIVPESPVKPTVPKPVTPPEETKIGKYPEKRPRKPKAIKPDPERVAEIQSDIDYELASDKDLHQYMADIGAQDQDQTAAHEAKLAKWKLGKEKFMADHKTEMEEAQKEYEEQKAEYDAALEGLESDLEAYEEAKDKVDKESGAIIAHWLKDYGCVYGHLKDANSGRCINGYPMFFAMGYLHREDLPIVIEGCRREQQRRQEMDSDLDDLLPPEEKKAKKKEKRQSKADKEKQKRRLEQEVLRKKMDALHRQLEDKPISKKKEERLEGELDQLQSKLFNSMMVK